jgi:hypothetical protein
MLHLLTTPRVATMTNTTNAVIDVIATTTTSCVVATPKMQ